MTGLHTSWIIKLLILFKAKDDEYFRLYVYMTFSQRTILIISNSLSIRLALKIINKLIIYLLLLRV